MVNKYYLNTHYGDNCHFGDNATKRRWRFNEAYENSVFDRYMRSYCGGRCSCQEKSPLGGSFWSAFGVSLGMGAANMLCGFLGGLFQPRWR